MVAKRSLEEGSFHNECRFELFPRHNAIVCRTKTEKFCQTGVAPAVQQGGDVSMICGCTMPEVPGECEVVSGGMKSDKYCEIMEEVLIPSAQTLLGIVTPTKKTMFHPTDPR